MTRLLSLCGAILGGVMLAAPAVAAVPALLHHQGRMAANGVAFDGTGQFKFALVDGTGAVSYWSNDGTSTAGSQPATAVSLAVSKGLYSVLLGNTTLPNMAALPPSIFENPDVRLRLWFNDGVNGFQLISPDQQLAAAPYALVASSVDHVTLDDVVAPPVKPVVAWGGNNGGQTAVPALSTVAAIAAGSSHSLALLDAGTVVSWGSAPAVPAGLSHVSAIAAGAYHSLALKSDGSVVAWGDNTYGQSSVPGGITNAVAVAAGEKHSLVLRSNGTLTAWGNNSFSQTTVPATATEITAIACGHDHSLALRADGTVIAWGRNDSQQCTVPPGLSGVTAIAAGAYHSLAAKSDGSVVAWGWNLGGQTSVPAELSGAIRVAGGYGFSLALQADGSVIAWGDASRGATSIPAEATRVTAIAAGASHALALRADLIPAQVARLDQDNTLTGRLGIKRPAAANTLEIEGQASKSTAGNWLANSDARIKTDVQPVTGALEKLSAVRLVEFRYTDAYRAAHPAIEDKRYLNVIAQEFARLFPDDVKSSGESLADGSAILQVDTYPLTIYSAAAIQELHRENQALKQKLAAQEDRLRRLESALDAQ